MSDPYQPPSSNIRPTQAALYSLQGIVIATIIGSLAAAVAILFLNYRALNAPALADKAAMIGLAIYLVLIGIAALLPESLLFALLFMVIQVAIAYFAAATLQGHAIRYHRQRGGAMHSNVRAAGVGLIAGMSIMVVVLMLATLLAVITSG